MKSTNSDLRNLPGMSVADTTHSHDAGLIMPQTNERYPRAVNRAVFALLPINVLLYVLSRLWKLSAYDLWADELTTFGYVVSDWSSMTTYVIQDIVHPPLFYVFLKLWVIIGGDSLIWIRLFPALTAICAIVPLLLICRELKFSLIETNLVLLLSGVNGYLIYYSQELRMYSLLLLLGLWSKWLFLRYARATGGYSRTLMPLFVVNLLLIYTQYYGWLLVMTEFVILVLWMRDKAWWFGLSMLVLGVCFSPWLLLVIQAAQAKGGMEENLGWIARPSVLDVIWQYVILNGPLRSSPLAKWISFLAVFLFGLPILLWVWRVFLKTNIQVANERFALSCLILFSVLPTVIAFGASQILPQAVWHPRYLIIIALPYILLTVAALRRLPPLWFRYASVIIVGWAILSGVREQQHTDKIAWRGVIDHMIRNEPTSTDHAQVFAFGSHLLPFYFDQAHDTKFQVTRVSDRQAMLDPSYTWDAERFWISFRTYGDRYRHRQAYSEAQREEQHQLAKLQTSLQEKGYQITNEFQSGATGSRVFVFHVSR